MGFGTASFVAVDKAVLSRMTEKRKKVRERERER
jgi:hypothetical protein